MIFHLKKKNEKNNLTTKTKLFTTNKYMSAVTTKMKLYTTSEFISNNISFKKEKSCYKDETLHN